MNPDATYIWQLEGWPTLVYDRATVGQALARARRAQGKVEGQLAALGFDEKLVLEAEAWSQEAVATAAIEGERYDLLAVRSSVARRLGVGDQEGPVAPRNVEGLLDIMDDAALNNGAKMTHKRLHAWQAALFPTGYSGLIEIRVGGYRRHAQPMQVVSGRMSRETVYYEAPPSARVQHEMQQLLDWFNTGAEPDSLVLAALMHLWFETVHPFEDGNGRVGRVWVDLSLARDSGGAGRLIRMSQRLLERRADYYRQLAAAQHGGLDVTTWVHWFIQQFQAACEAASTVIDDTLAKARFWTEHRDKPLNQRQRKIMNLLLNAGPDGLEGGMSTRKYESIGSTSRATASRELIELEAAGLLQRTGAGRSTRYHVKMSGWGSK